MARTRTRPGDVILDLLRSARGRRQSVSALVERGALFGFSENTIRVTLSRLMSRGRIESPGRGEYRLSPETDALNDFVERWRLGEDRIRAWQPGRWLLAHLADADGPSSWALDALGFRSVRTGLFARPDNLALPLDQLRRLAVSIGLTESALMIAGEPAGDTAEWIPTWQPEALNRDYRDSLARLTASAERLDTLPAAEAQLECFRLGGEMIHRLAKDPLLPEPFADVAARRALWQATIDYDRQGKEIWARASQADLNRMPHPRLAAAPS